VRALTVIIALLAGLLGFTSSAAAAGTYTNGDEWGAWSVPHDVSLNCSGSDKPVKFTILHGKNFVSNLRKTATGYTFTIAATDNTDRDDEAVAATVTCKVAPPPKVKTKKVTIGGTIVPRGQTQPRVKGQWYSEDHQLDGTCPAGYRLASYTLTDRYGMVQDISLSDTTLSLSIVRPTKPRPLSATLTCTR
jgi:hypothetical protein